MDRRLLNVCVLVATLVAFAAPARASKDIVQFGTNIEVAPDTTAHDTVCFFCSVNDRGSVEGDIVVFFGNVHIDGHANHDVVNFFGNVTLTNDSTIGQDLVSMFGTIRLGENVSIGKDLVAMFGRLRAAPSVNVGGDRVVQPGWIVWGPLLILSLVVILIVREVRSQRRRAYLRGFPLHPPQ